MKTHIINAGESPLGRVASDAAKEALRGHEVIIVNCDNTRITGRKSDIIEKYVTLRKKGGSNQKGPYFPSDPARIMKRIVRGMLPSTQLRGREALKRVRCYNDIPEQYASAKSSKHEIRNIARSMTLREVSNQI